MQVAGGAIFAARRLKAAQDLVDGSTVNVTPQDTKILKFDLSQPSRHFQTGKAITLEMQLRIPARGAAAGAETALAVLTDSTPAPLFFLTLTPVNGSAHLQFSLRTDHSEVPLRVAVPVSLIGFERTHRVVARYSGPKLDLYVDGVLLDEEWPMGSLRPEGDAVLRVGSPGVHDWVHHATLWQRALTDSEINSLSGSPSEIAERTLEYLGAPSNQLQYWRPQGWNTSAGDAMPLMANGRFHVFYLFDRRHHKSKWGLGAHQWAHVSSADLVHWQHHPIALPISDESEGSICTGSVFFDGAQFRAFYATRKQDRSEQLGLALSEDGVHFRKLLPTPFREPASPYRSGPNRDPFVFFDDAAKNYKMLVTAELADPPAAHRGGALELLQSPDLTNWTVKEPFLVPGYSGHQPECSDLFRWNSWFYVLFGQDGATHYRMSHSAAGPWKIPAMDILDDPQARVMKTAAFGENRRFGVAFVAEKGFGGNLLFRELVQNSDGSLGTKFPREMIPAAGDSIAWQVPLLSRALEKPHDRVRVAAMEGFGAIAVEGVPQNAHITLLCNASSTVTAYGIGLRGQGKYERAVELRIEPFLRKVSWRSPEQSTLMATPLSTLEQVHGLDGPVSIKIISKDDLFDVEMNSCRTAIHRAEAMGDRLFLFAMGGEVTFDKLEIRSLL